MNARHLHVSFMNAVQYIIDIPPDIRAQYSYVCATSENIHQNKKRLHQAFFGCFDKYADFDKAFSQITRDYKVAVLDQTDPSAEISRQLFWYKARLKGEKFKIGRPVYWRLQQEHCDKKSCTALSIVGD